jgi:hypothetical protein
MWCHQSLLGKQISGDRRQRGPAILENAGTAPGPPVKEEMRLVLPTLSLRSRQ